MWSQSGVLVHGGRGGTGPSEAIGAVKDLAQAIRIVWWSFRCWCGCRPDASSPLLANEWFCCDPGPSRCGGTGAAMLVIMSAGDLVEADAGVVVSILASMVAGKRVPMDRW